MPDKNEPIDLQEEESSEDVDESPIRLEPVPIDHQSTHRGDIRSGIIVKDPQLSIEEWLNPEFEEEEKTENKALQKFKNAIFFLVLLGMSYGIYTLYKEEKKRSRSINDVGISPLVEVEMKKLDYGDLEKVQTLKAQITQEVIGFVSANTIEERFKHSRQYPELRQRMEKFYQKHEFLNAPLEPKQIEIGTPGDIDGIKFYRTKVNWQGIGKVNLAVVKTPDGYGVDWDSLEIWQPMPWSEFLKSGSESPQAFRVFVSPDRFYVDPYTYEEYISLKLSSGSLATPIYAYVKRSPELVKKFGVQFAAWSANDIRPFKMTLSLRYIMPISQSHVVEVVDVAASSWLAVLPPQKSSEIQATSESQP